jgi:hypothetical protein
MVLKVGGVDHAIGSAVVDGVVLRRDLIHWLGMHRRLGDSPTGHVPAGHAQHPRALAIVCT